MKVLIVNTTERTGGAAIAATRLMHALQKEGVKVSMLCRSARLPFYWERLRIFMENRLSKRNLWQIDIANCGEDITKSEAFREADVIHLHWINQGFLSMKNLEAIFHSGKRIIWTLHDQWPYTGICHYANNCDKYLHHCHFCPLLAHPLHHDLSYKLFRKKHKLFREADITFVGCSRWITEDAQEASLTQGNRVVNIPNAIPKDIFHPMSKSEVREMFHLPQDKHLVLFGSQKVTDERKGVKFLAKACKRLRHENIELIVAGNASQQLQGLFSQPIHFVGYIESEQSMAALYAAADVFVTPSLEDNLPNTIAEAMSCGTPCVGFRIGGIPEMIHHQQDGYVARYRDAKDLEEGIRYVLAHPELGEAAVQYASETYDEARVAQLYMAEYRNSSLGPFGDAFTKRSD